MTVAELAKLVDGNVVTQPQDSAKEVQSMYSCDLLSWAMAKLTQNSAFVTIINNRNIVAVASLSECSCIVLCENVECEDAIIKKANEEEIPIIVSPLSSYEICARYGRLHP